MQPFPYFSLLVEGLMFILLEKEMKYLYYKQHTGTLIVRRSADVPQWVKWVHHVSGLLHCPECLMLDGCWFQFEKAPMWPHHEKCHCTLEPIDYFVVIMNATAKSDFSKFDPYLFNTTGSTPTEKKNCLHSGDILLMMQAGCALRWSVRQEKNTSLATMNWAN